MISKTAAVEGDRVLTITYWFISAAIFNCLNKYSIYPTVSEVLAFKYLLGLDL